MSITKVSKEYHEKMFPGYHSRFLETDYEFIERFDNFAFDEVVNHDDLDGKTRFLAILATLLGCQGIDEFRAMIPAALNSGRGKGNRVSGRGIPWHRQSVPVLEGCK